MIIGAYVVAVVLFCIAFRFTGLISTAVAAFSISREGVNVMLDSSLDDLEKERGVQKAALGLMRSCVLLFFKGGVAFCAAVFPLWLGDFMGWVSMDKSIQFALRWDVIMITSVVIMVLIMVWGKLRKNSFYEDFNVE